LRARCAELSVGDPFVTTRADATSIDMRIIFEDKNTAVVCPNALSRSPLLADIHQEDADGLVSVPCNASTWAAWLADDPLALMLDVIKVQTVYTQERWMLACATGSWTLL
jgi:hypothetical protein